MVDPAFGAVFPLLGEMPRPWMHQAHDFVASCYRFSHVLGSAMPCFASLWSGVQREWLDGPRAVHRVHRTWQEAGNQAGERRSEALRDPADGITSSVGSQPIVAD